MNKSLLSNKNNNTSSVNNLPIQEDPPQLSASKSRVVLDDNMSIPSIGGNGAFDDHVSFDSEKEDKPKQEEIPKKEFKEDKEEKNQSDKEEKENKPTQKNKKKKSQSKKKNNKKEKRTHHQIVNQNRINSLCNMEK